MPYMIVSKQINFDDGLTYVGDVESDPQLMSHLNAELKTLSGNNYSSYTTTLLPRIILNMLEEKGWKLVSTTGIGQTIAWTLHHD